MINLQVVRDCEKLTDDGGCTFGKLLYNGEFFCFTLEDVVRPYGVKVYGKTAIPEGEYKGAVNYSGRFKKLLPVVYTEPDGYTIKKGGISYSWVRIHGGNDEEDTLGCILVAYHINIEDGKIWKSASIDLVEKLNKDGGKFTLTVKNVFKPKLIEASKKKA